MQAREHGVGFVDLSVQCEQAGESVYLLGSEPAVAGRAAEWNDRFVESL